MIAYQEDTAPARIISPVAEIKAAVHKAAKRLYLAREDISVWRIGYQTKRSKVINVPLQN